jgi:site-specific DNA recombinase
MNELPRVVPEPGGARARQGYPLTGGVSAVLSQTDINRSSSTKRAVLYLRVSTPSQVNTDYDPEGISIPAQRVACERKATQMDAEIIEEYVEPGRSGTKMDKRPAFQAMLERIRRDRDIDYVIVYKLSRMNRNRVDDALVLMNLRKFNVALVSATESIDETPVGQLMHGILAAFNEFRSAEDGADISYKMAEKARRGGTLGRAPLGYLNIRDRFEGREVRSVTIDPERAPFVHLAFELYATGAYSLDTLAEELTRRGLRTRPSRFPAGPISTSKLQVMLRNRYYLGYVQFKDSEYPGRHEALVDLELFEKVQAVLDARSKSGERRRVHHHYLKGTIWCGQCHDLGIERRMIVARAKGHGGTYYYFFCRGRQDHTCNAPYLQIDETEDAIARFYGTLRLDSDFAAKIRRVVADTLADQENAAKLRHRQLSNEILRLDRQEENLLDLAADASLPRDKLRLRLGSIQTKRDALAKELEQVDVGLAAGGALIEATIDLLDDPEELYRQAGPDQRQFLNQAFFEKLYIDRGAVTDAALAEPFGELVEAQKAVRGLKRRAQKVGQASPVSDANPFLEIFQARGSSKNVMVGAEGLEPPTCWLYARVA